MLVEVVDVAYWKNAARSLLDDGGVVGVKAGKSLELLDVVLDEGLHLENELRIHVDQLRETIGRQVRQTFGEAAVHRGALIAQRSVGRHQ